MSTTNKSNTWKLVLQLIVAALSAIATTLGVTSCMGANIYLYMALRQNTEVNPNFFWVHFIVFEIFICRIDI